MLTDLWQGRWKQSLQEIETYFDNSETFARLPTRLILLEETLPTLYALEKDYSKAAELLEITIGQLTQPEIEPFMSRWVAIHLYWKGRILWEAGDLAQVRQTLARLNKLEYASEWPFVPLLRDLLNGLLLMSEQRYPEARVAFLKALPIQHKISFTIQYNDVRLLLAYLYLLEDNQAGALIELETVLGEYKREQIPGLLICQGRKLIVPLLQLAVAHNLQTEFAAHILELLDEPALPRPTASDSTQLQEIQHLRIPQTGETLTSREIEIIKLLARRASNREIATELFISELTVKSHVSNILRKLNLTSRNEVAISAQKLKLV